MDYRDALQTMMDELRKREGLSWYQIATRAGTSEQILLGVLRKERNLSIRSLHRLLHRLDYRMSFEPIPPVSHSENPISQAS